MANNRVHLYCPVCDAESPVIAKCMSQGYYLNEGDVEVGRRFVDFLASHFHCDHGKRRGASYLGVGHGTAVELRFEHHADPEREANT